MADGLWRLTEAQHTMVSLRALSRRQIATILIVAGAVIAAVGVEQLVVTERERILRVIAELRAAVERVDVPGIFEHVSSDYYEEAIPREQLRSLAHLFFRHYGPTRVHIFETGVNRIGDLAVVELHVSTSARPRGYASLAGQSTWELDLQKEPDGAWRVTRLVPLRIGGEDVAGWPDALDKGGL